MIARYCLGALDPGGATGTPCVFAATTFVGGSASFEHEVANITGAAGAIVTIQLTLYTNSNHTGRVLANFSPIFLNNTITVTLDGSGNGNFDSQVDGDPTQTGTIVRAQYTITNVTIGQLGLGAAIQYQISKVF